MTDIQSVVKDIQVESVVKDILAMKNDIQSFRITDIQMMLEDQEWVDDTLTRDIQSMIMTEEDTLQDIRQDIQTKEIDIQCKDQESEDFLMTDTQFMIEIMTEEDIRLDIHRAGILMSVTQLMILTEEDFLHGIHRIDIQMMESIMHLLDILTITLARDIQMTKMCL